MALVMLSMSGIVGNMYNPIAYASEDGGEQASGRSASRIVIVRSRARPVASRTIDHARSSSSLKQPPVLEESNRYQIHCVSSRLCNIVGEDTDTTLLAVRPKSIGGGRMTRPFSRDNRISAVFTAGYAAMLRRLHTD